MSRKLHPIRRLQGRPHEMTDEALVAACGAGSPAALGALFDRYYADVRRFLARMSGTDDRDLDDLVQTTFETVYRTARKFRGRSAVKTWMFGIAGNVARHHIRSEVRRRRLASAFASAPRPTAVDAGARAERRDLAAQLRDAIAGLAPKLREAFVLVYLEGMSGKQAAAIAGCREGTIWKRLHQARAALRDELGGAQE